jgi:N-acylglucosamine 2-epimerase
MSDEVFDHFYRPGRNLVLERIASDNSEYPAPLGTAVVPGHVIEDMWFQIHIARSPEFRRRFGPARQKQRIALACDLIQRHLEVGWDKEYGGLFLAVDADGREQVGWNFADAKLWWPHTEALYATLLAFEHAARPPTRCTASGDTAQPWALQWHEKVRTYSLAHFPVSGHGEWTQRLTRTGQPLTEVVALPVKDPFHLPRALIYCIEVLERLAD